MIRQCDRKIILQDGTEFYGYSFGASGDCTAEIVFNTSMVGYQEILSDPSYTGQAIVMTYPLIGNYGMCEEDYESLRPTASAMIVREYNDEPSNFRAVMTLGQVMEKNGIIGIAGVDKAYNVSDLVVRAVGAVNGGFCRGENIKKLAGDNVGFRCPAEI